MIAFVCHPYHRGGVTSWMKNAYVESKKNDYSSFFITVVPKIPFLSAGNRPNMVSFVEIKEGVYYKRVGIDFELGNLDYRSSIYRKLILEKVDAGSILIPSDDEACWKACCQLADKYKVIGVLHSDDPTYYDLYEKYNKYLSGAVSVSKRIRSYVSGSNDSLPHTVIPCGIPLAEFHIKAKFQNVISWIGRVEEEQKRVSDLPKISEELKQTINDWEMHVYGDGGPLKELKSKTKETGLDKNLYFHGWTPINQIKEHLSHSKILLQTSNFEGMSVAVMEALASGCIIVSSKVSGVEDLADDPDAKDIVYLYPVGNIDLAKKQLMQALSDHHPERPNQARKLAEKHYGIDSCLKAYQRFGYKLEVNNQAYPKSKSQRLNNVLSHLLARLRYLKFKMN